MTQEDSKAGDMVAIARATYESYVSKDRAAIEARDLDRHDGSSD